MGHRRPRRAIGDRDVGNFIDPRPHASTVPLEAGQSVVIILASDGIWDAMLPSAVDAVVRGAAPIESSAIARVVCQTALSTRHAYSSQGDEVPIDDTTVVIMKVEHSDDPFTDSGNPCC